jgi:small-conductance mechanosensitive channel/CRP-like cAMP-binding protein
MTLPDFPVRDGLLALAVFLSVYVSLIWLTQRLRKTKGLNFGRLTHFFLLCVAVLAGLLLSPFEAGWEEILIPHLKAATILSGCFPLIVILNHFLWTDRRSGEKRREAPRLLADTTGLLVFVAVLILVLQYIYKVRVPGLLAGSGVIAIILGLAMQDLLGNIFGGLSIFMDKPFRTGDWLNVDGTDAKVLEVTWRSTRLLTNDDVLIDVPNHHIVRQIITNFERPSPEHRVSAEISLHYDAPPRRVQQVLAEAVVLVPHVLADPKPVVFLKSYLDSGILYEIRVWIKDHRFANEVLSQVRVVAWYAARRANLEIPYPQLTLHRPRPQPDGQEMEDEAAQILGKHPIFGFLEPGQIGKLVKQSPVQLFTNNEALTRQGGTGESMFLLLRGECDVKIRADQTDSTVASLHAGDCLGEMSLLSGDPRNATVVAVGEVVALEISRVRFKTLVHEHPAILEKLSELLARRQLANEQFASTGAASTQRSKTSASILRGLRDFFYLGDSSL